MNNNLRQEAVLTVRKSFTSDSPAHPSMEVPESIPEIGAIVENVFQKKKMIGNAFWELLDALSYSRVAPLGSPDLENELTGRVVKLFDNVNEFLGKSSCPENLESRIGRDKVRKKCRQEKDR